MDATVRGRAIGELDDIDALVRNYRPRLLRFVTFSIGDADMAETIVQDTFLRAHRAREGFRGDASAITFLTSIALNLIRDRQRTQKFRFWKQVEPPRWTSPMSHRLWRMEARRPRRKCLPRRRWRGFTL
jgi:DNA-directed RNA polymerase specialized sigma24 family protein